MIKLTLEEKLKKKICLCSFVQLNPWYCRNEVWSQWADQSTLMKRVHYHWREILFMATVIERNNYFHSANKVVASFNFSCYMTESKLDKALYSSPFSMWFRLLSTINNHMLFQLSLWFLCLFLLLQFVSDYP